MFPGVALRLRCRGLNASSEQRDYVIELRAHERIHKINSGVSNPRRTAFIKVDLEALKHNASLVIDWMSSSACRGARESTPCGERRCRVYTCPWGPGAHLEPRHVVL